jgi:hypothetical protein
MYAAVSSVQRLAGLQAPGTRRREAGGGWREAGGGWRVAGGRRRMLSEIMTSVDILV